ncbi:MAG: hypothetical protein L3J14_02430 [Flavobacteriaceae bacterium]|nr:hypothetical protein [Flavobacteriaceae bacterium]
MKNFRIYSIFAVAMSMILLIACSTEDEVQIQEQIAPSGTIEIKMVEYSSPFAKGGGSSSFLAFNDMNAFRTTVAQLETDMETHDDAFINSWPNLTADQLSDKEQVVGFDSYQPLKNFETLYGFNSSMRKDYEIAENDWLNKSDLIESNDPDKTYYELDVEQMAVLNNVGAVKIGNSIFKVFKGGVAEITDGDIATLNVIGFDDCVGISQRQLANVVVYGGCGGTGDGGGNPPAGASCFYDGVNRTNWGTATRRKMKGVVKVVNSPIWGVKIKSKTKYYKKSWGIWWLRRSNLTAALDGYYDENSVSDCGDNAFFFNENIDKKSVVNKKRVKYVAPLNSSSQLYILYNIIQ